MNDSRQWIPTLAGYRALAALAVYVFHIVSIDPPGGLVGRLTVPLGNAAVAVFFVLSGFLIYRPYAAWAFGHGPPISSWRFVARRVVRILPLYWVVLTAHLFVFAPQSANSLGEYLTAYALIQNFRGSLVFVPPFVAWSLCIELWFSLALPLIAAPLRRLSVGRSPVGVLRTQMLGILCVMILGPAFRVWALDSPVESGRLLWMPAYLDWFGYGLGFAVLTTFWRRYGASATVRGIGPNAWLGIVIGAVAYWAVTKLGLPGGFVSPTAFQVHSQFALQGLMSAALVGAAIVPRADLGTGGRVLSSRLFGWLGALSYGIYLGHPIVADELASHWPDLSRWLMAPMALALTLVVAALLHRYVERPASVAIDRLVTRSRRLDSAGLTADRSAPTETRQVAGEALTVGPHPSDFAGEGSGPTASNAAAIHGILRRPGVMATALIMFSFVTPLLSRPGVYVADARYELFADPGARLARMWQVWDGSRDIGRPAEEFWPGLTALAAIFSRAGAEPWLNQRLIHGVLLALAATGALMLGMTFRPDGGWKNLCVAVVYGFGPFSALYFVPSPLYVGYALAPWTVIAVVLSARGVQPYRWAGIVSLGVFAAGNADPPGLVFALVPAAFTWLVLMARPAPSRGGLIRFTVTCFVMTGLSSLAGLTKTGLGASALSHRLLETETVEAVSSTSSFTEAIRGSGFWLSYFSLGPTRFRTHQLLFIDNGWIVIATFGPIVLGIGALWWHRFASPARLLALAWIVIGTVLVAGAFPVEDPSPYGQLLLDLYRDHDLAFAFRSTHKAGVVVALGTALLGGWAMGDVASIVAPRLGTLRRLPLLAVAVLALMLTQPFWRTPLYDPVLVSGQIPEHWTELGAFFDVEPPTGRVLVLPGSTNNGYRWGSVGDDLLDPIIPNRIVTSTLPLSTPLPAELVDRLSRHVASPAYRPGALAPIAQRLGISHVVIRNDLEWERQGVDRPRDLDPLRSDPDLRLVASFGQPGDGVVAGTSPEANLAEARLTPIEVYAIGGGTDLSPVLVRQSDDPRQVLVDGSPGSITDLASVGLLDGGHVVRLTPTIDEAQLGDVLPDTALIVLTDSNAALDRRINYYGYDFAPAASLDSANAWLPGFSGDTVTTDQLEGAAVSSTVDRWLAGLDGRAVLAMDGDPDTYWSAPFLAGETQVKWTGEFDPPMSGTIEIELLDEEGRVGSLDVDMDGVIQSVPVTDSGRVLLVVDDPVAVLRLSFGEVESGLSEIGLREVRVERPPNLVRTLPAQLTDQLESGAHDGMLDGIPFAVLLGSGPASPRLTATFSTWRSEEIQLAGLVVSDFPRVRCETKALRLDGEWIQVRSTPNGDGTSALAWCTTQAPVLLEAGEHRIEFAPGDGDVVAELVLMSPGAEPAPIERVSITPGMELLVNDLVVFPASFDRAWRFDGVEPFAADTLAAWVVARDHSFEPPIYEPERTLRAALAGTAVGLWLSVAALVLGGRFGTSVASARPTDSNVITMDELAPEGSSRRYATMSFDLGACLLGWALGGVWAGVGAAAALLWSRRFDPRWCFGVAALCLGAVAVVVAAPVLPADSGLLDPTRDDRAIRAVIGVCLGAGLAKRRRFSAESRR